MNLAVHRPWTSAKYITKVVRRGVLPIIRRPTKTWHRYVIWSPLSSILKSWQFNPVRVKIETPFVVIRLHCRTNFRQTTKYSPQLRICRHMARAACLQPDLSVGVVIPPRSLNGDELPIQETPTETRPFRFEPTIQDYASHTFSKFSPRFLHTRWRGNWCRPDLTNYDNISHHTL
jgi:hypothetical protein